MKKATNRKALMLSLAMALGMLLPMTTNAQSDGFFRGGFDNYENRDGDIHIDDGTGMTNEQFGAPLGSGLLILAAAGAGYVVARRKRSRKGIAMFLALTMILSFTQCKKNTETVSNVVAEKVQITLDVETGGRHEVLPDGQVNFQDGDVIYVGDGSTYIGTLTRSGETFSGEINEPTGSSPKLHFFFIGGVYSGSLVKGTTPSITVDISDQSTTLPVLSYNSVDYTGSGSYSCKLKNQCALVELTLTSGTTAAVGIGDRYTEATINFGGTPGIAPNTSTTGMITMKPSGEDNTKKYAILLPQAAVAGSAIAIGPEGYTLDIPAIENNGFAKLSNSSAVASNIVYLNYLTSNYEAANGKTITGTLGANVKVSIADGATVTLNNAIINGTNNSSYKWAGITCLGDATIILSGTNTVKGFYEDYPGIQAAVGKTLTLNGTGSLTASSNGYGVGIGGGYNIACGNIEIQGGTVEATGGNQAAGIGSGFLGTCGNITISGGTVTATGGNNGGAGIGSGYEGTCGNITITRGVTQVTATMGGGATNSIGAGYEGTCGTVTIGGVVTGPITTSPYTYYPGPLTYPIALSAAASDYVGSVVTTDGYVYATVDAADAASKTAVAIIAYVGTAGSVDASSDTYKGLAIALSDANSGSNCQWAEAYDGYANCLSSSQTSDITTALGFKNGITCTSTLTEAGHSSHNHTAATAAVSNNGTAAPTGTSGWFMPSMGQWNLIVQGLATKKAGSAVTTDLTYQTDNPTYKADNLNSVITDAGGTGFQKNSYWASTEQTPVRAWVIYFTNGYAFNYAKNTTYKVRSVIAF